MQSDEDVTTADARIAFLRDEPLPGRAVRQPILSSWARSRELHVDPDRIDLGTEADRARSSPFLDLAAPVLHQLTDLMASEPVSVILCDTEGVVLERRTGDTALSQHLDRVWLAPGFSYAERYVGTNGIGTALESRAPVHVFGPEHWAEGLEDLACAAVPVRHPVTGRLAGLVNLTCWRRDANPMLMATAKLLAHQVETELREDVGRREAAVLEDFLVTCRRSRHPVLAVSGDVVILDDTARDSLDKADTDRVVAAAAEAFASGRRARLVVDLPSGRTARLDCRPTWSEPDAGGGVVVVLPASPVPSPARPPGAPAAHPTASPAVPLGTAPGRTASAHRPLGSAAIAVGTGTHWTICRQTVDRHRAAGEWVVLRGEPGSGRRTLAAAAARAHAPDGRLRVLDRAELSDRPDALQVVADELTRRRSTLVLADVDALAPDAVRALMDTLEPHRWSTAPDRPWVVVTVGADRPRPAVTRLVERLPATVDVPPLRQHAEDVAELVGHVLRRLGHERLVVPPDVLAVLQRCRWPGNVTQLESVLARVVARRRSGAVTPEDLPAEVFAGVRRVLTPVEALECDALVGALRQTGGSRAKAAALLGMSRATVYRKVREYGLDL